MHIKRPQLSLSLLRHSEINSDKKELVFNSFQCKKGHTKKNVYLNEQHSRPSLNLSITNDSRLKDEILPSYSCTVHKVGICHAKIEVDSLGAKPWRRPWRHIFMELRGTFLQIYEIKTFKPLYLPTFPADYQQTFKWIPLINLSLSQLEAVVADDYKKRSNVFRIIDSSLRLLIQVQTMAEMRSWMEKISAGKNIAVDFVYPPILTIDCLGCIA
ncbi:hypothetical protein RMATCC62417_07789 [Rhizopus microsporus]|nr:hypothetical protein RMATCC62417_07789 [Rhizopus microsporus]